MAFQVKHLVGQLGRQWGITISATAAGIGAGLVAALAGRLAEQSLFIPIALGALVVGLILPVAVTPISAYYLWGIMLIVYVLWPGSQKIWGRVGQIPIEYIPPVTILTVGLISGILRGMSPIPRRPRILAILTYLILLYGAISVLWIRSWPEWLVGLSMWAIYLTSFWGVANNIAATRLDRCLNFIRFLLASTAAYSLIGIVRAALVGTIGTAAHYSPLIRYPYIEGFLALYLIPIALAMYIRERNITYLVYVISYTAASLLLFSRTVLVGLIVEWLAMMALFNRQFIRILVLLIICLGGVGVAFSIQLITNSTSASDIPDRLLARLNQVMLVQYIWFGSEAEVVQLNPDDVAGQVWFREAVRIFQAVPITGTGVGNYREYYSVPAPFDEPTRARNFYASYLAEFGIVGFSLILGFILYLTYWLVRRGVQAGWGDSGWVTLGIAAAQLPFPVMLLGEEFVSTPYVWFYWGLAVGCQLSLVRGGPPSAHSKQGFGMAAGSDG